MSNGIVNLLGTYGRSKMIPGYEKLNDADPLDKLSILKDVIDEWSSDWPKDQGFGSSDGTYLLQDYIDHMISYLSLGDTLETTFSPTLSITEKI